MGGLGDMHSAGVFSIGIDHFFWIWKADFWRKIPLAVISIAMLLAGIQAFRRSTSCIAMAFS